MKAKDLAALLLQNPEMEVFYEDYIHVDFGDSYHTVKSVDGVNVTPGGVYLDINYIQNKNEFGLKPPSSCPVIDTIRIKLDDEEFPYLPFEENSSDNYGEYFFRDYAEEKTFYTFSGSEKFILYDSSVDESSRCDYTNKEIEDNFSIIFDISKVEYVEVLTSFDDQWNPTYTNMTFDEAMSYFLKEDE